MFEGLTIRAIKAMKKVELVTLCVSLKDYHMRHDNMALVKRDMDIDDLKYKVEHLTRRLVELDVKNGRLQDTVLVGWYELYTANGGSVPLTQSTASAMAGIASERLFWLEQSDDPNNPDEAVAKYQEGLSQ